MIKTIIQLLRFKKLATPPKDAIRKAGKLQPGATITYYIEYDDGCTYTEYDNGAKSWEGRSHSPHIEFYPDDLPIREYKIQC